MSVIDNKQVETFFSTAALKHENENAVLDVAAGQEHSNRYRNYFTTAYILKNLSPKKNETILDFGCGVGRISKLLADKSCTVVGVDTSAAMIEVAKQKFNSKNKIRYEALHEIKISCPENYFDTAFSHWVFQHINDQELIMWLNEFKRALKPSGRIILFEQIKNKSTESAKHLFRTPDQYKSLFEKAGLKNSSSFPVMRVPSRGMSVWNKLPSFKFLLPLISEIDHLTLHRKPELADYFTFCFVLSK